MTRVELIEKRVEDSIEQGRTTTPRGLHETAYRIWVVRTSLEDLEDISLYSQDNTTNYIIELENHLKDEKQGYNSMFFMDSYENQMWETREFVSPKGSKRFQVWWGPSEDYSAMAGGHILPYPHLVRVDQYLKPEQILSINRKLWLAHKRTPIEVAAA